MISCFTTCQWESTSKAEALFKEALSLSSTKDKVLARDRLSEAMRLWTRMGEPEKVVRSSLLMGDSYKRLKRFQESLYYYKQALEVKPLSNQVKAIAFNSVEKVYGEIYQTYLDKRYSKKLRNRRGLPEMFQYKRMR
jgi:tetratricopeptide (TPR) repeat protein